MSEPVVDEDEVRHVAELARIYLSDADVERFRADFVDILEYFDRLDEVPDIDVDEERVNVLRPDEVRESVAQVAALANANETEDGYFKGPPVS